MSFLIVVFLPLISFLLIAFLGRRIGSYGAMLLSSSSLGLAFLSSLLLFFVYAQTGSTVVVEFPLKWFKLGLLEVFWGFNYDSLCAVMFLVVTSVSFLVHLYSVEYMAGDPHRARFFSYLSLFTFFMLFLVSSSNLIQLFVGWEGVGLCSFLLINFWFTRHQANKSAIKAVLMNRFGDIALLLAISLLAYYTKSVSFADIYVSSSLLLEEIFVFKGIFFSVADLVSFCLILAAVGKSAQLGLHTWLPDAMEGPTPVSALIHAATMVTAGIFLLLRGSHILDLSVYAKPIILVVGALTALFGASVGAFQNDIKKVVAYSTCSQLGYMAVACGLGAYNLAAFHLYNHAFFKALLFLSAGAVIHAVNDEQDMRRMGGLAGILPLSHISFLVGSLSLMGLPFLTGFYSKDLILELALAGSGLHFFVYTLILAAAFFTSYYSIRLMLMVFWGKPQGIRKVVESAHEPGLFMSLPLVVLFIATCFTGYVSKDLFVGFGSDFWKGSISTPSSYINMLVLAEVEISTLFKQAPLIVSFVASLLAYLVFSSGSRLTKPVTAIVSFFSKKWYWDAIYNRFVSYPIIKGFFYEGVFRSVDKGILEVFGPAGVVAAVRSFANVKNAHTGYLFDYVIYLVLSFVVFLVFVSNTTNAEAYYDLFVLFFLGVIVFPFIFNEGIKKEKKK